MYPRQVGGGLSQSSVPGIEPSLVEAVCERDAYLQGFIEAILELLEDDAGQLVAGHIRPSRFQEDTALLNEVRHASPPDLVFSLQCCVSIVEVAQHHLIKTFLGKGL